MIATSSASAPFGSTMCSSGASIIVVLGDAASRMGLSSWRFRLAKAPVGGVVEPSMSAIEEGMLGDVGDDI